MTLPAVRIATRIAIKSTSVRSSFRPRVCQWKAGSRRSFALRSCLLDKKYTEDHEWIELDSSGKIGTMGITAYAAQQLGDVVYVELPEVGMEINKGDTLGAVESVKSASDIMSPLTGKVTESNLKLEETPGHINKDPEGGAWFAKIEVKTPSEMDTLMNEEAYIKFTEEAS